MLLINNEQIDSWIYTICMSMIYLKKNNLENALLFYIHSFRTVSFIARSKQTIWMFIVIINHNNTSWHLHCIYRMSLSVLYINSFLKLSVSYIFKFGTFPKKRNQNQRKFSKCFFFSKSYISVIIHISTSLKILLKDKTCRICFLKRKARSMIISFFFYFVYEQNWKTL